jgi:polyphenol oxidase
MNNMKNMIKGITRQYSNIKIDVSARNDGTMKNGKIINFKNVKNFLYKNNIPFKNTIFMHQVHGNNVEKVRDNSNCIIQNTDGIMTRKQGIFLGVFTADCIPLLFFNTKQNIVGAVHAGYKGILKGVVENMLLKIREEKIDMNDIHVIIGPSIRKCCYDVPEERVHEFIRKFPDFKYFYTRKRDRYFLDIQSIVVQVLLKNGIMNDNIHDGNICTQSNVSKYFSYRGDDDISYGEFVSIIGIGI